MLCIARVEALSMPDCWIAGGFVRNAVWDCLHGFHPGANPVSDIDVIYFDAARRDPAIDLAIQNGLNDQWNGPPFSVKNQARMHLRNGHAPYASAVDATRFWLERCTAVGVSCDGSMQVAAPLGTADLLGLIVRPTLPEYRERVRQRCEEKGWLRTWPNLRLVGL